MDTKTPPIPLKVQEKTKPRHQESVADVSLPPLAPYKNHRQKQKTPGTQWSRDIPSAIRYQDHQRKRPYRVLQIGATPLMHACQQGDRARVLRLLKEQEETIGYRDRTLRSALHYCMDAGTGGAVASAAPELVNAPDAEGHTPLHLAVIAGDTQLVAVLLANGADVNAKDLEGHSVLHWATVCGETECVRLVLAAGARPSTPDLRGGSPLHYAAQCCGAAATAELAVPKKVGLKVLQTLLEFGADVNAKDEDGRQPILWAASAGSVEAVLALARAGGSAAAGAADKDGLTALHCAASRGHARCVEALVNLCGAHPDHVDDNGCSALHYAATLGHADATALILKLGADPNRQDRKGRTPALCAAAKGQLETLKILAQHGGSLYARTVRGTGVAHEAVASGRIELIKWLAKKRPSTLDVATHDGKTPLHVAALHGHLDACKVLLDNGARINAVLRTSKGNLMTALDAALYRGHRDCAKLIQMHGGTTAQQLRMQKTVPNKVFAAKLRMRHVDSSTDTESSPRRRSCSHKLPELYYEEQWIEKRTRRRGNLRKLARQDSRGFSEEEVRLSKTSSKKDHQRRTRSESARYDEDHKLRRKRSRKRSRKSRHDSSESSTESDSYEQMDDSRQRFESKSSRSNGTEDKEESRRDEEDDESVSDDSLEVVVVRKSLAKKCEKMVSGRRSKTPRESSKETKFTKTHRSTRRKLKSSRSKTSDNGESTTDRMQSFDKEQGSKESEFQAQETPRTSMEEDKTNGGKVIQNRYRRDVTDSTSQETVERVVVTAMVHKDQGPDTPKSIIETSKEVTFDDRLRTEVIETEQVTTDTSVGKMDGIIEQSDESCSNLVTKAASLKKDVEEMRQQAILEKTQREEDTKRDEKEENVKQSQSDDGKRDERKDPRQGDVNQSQDKNDGVQKSEMEMDKKEKGRLDADETPESESPSDSQHQPSQREDAASKSTKLDENLDQDTHSEKTDLSERTSREDHEESEETSKSSQKDAQSEATTPRTAVEDVPASEDEDRKSTSEESKGKSKHKSETVKRKPSIDETKSKSSSSRQSDESPKKSGSSRKRRELSKRRESCTKKVSMKVSTEKTRKSSIEETTETQKVEENVITESVVKETSSKDSEEKEQVDSTRRKSVEFSSVPKEETVGGSLSVDAPTASKRRMSVEQEAVQESSQVQANQEEEEEIKKTKKHPVEDALTMEGESFRYIDESSSSSPKSAQARRSRPSTGKIRRTGRSKSSAKKCLFESSEERSPDRSAIIAVIESPEWDEEDEEIEKEIRDAIGEDAEHETEPEEDNEIGVVRVLPSTSEEETSRAGPETCRTSAGESLPQVQSSTRTRLTRIQSPQESRSHRLQGKQRRDSGGRDSGIEPSPRVSRIPRRRIMKCCPNSAKQQTLNMDTITRDVQISLRRYHLERKIFFQLMELKRLQIRHGRANEQVLVKRQVDAFHKAGMSGPTLGVAKYDQPLTFRHFEAFLYDQLRKLQKRPATPDFCTEAKQCTQKTHRCHHATSAYTSFPAYTYLGGGGQEQADLLPKIESRGKGQMTVEVTHGEEKQIIALPTEKLDRTKKYYVTFTVRGEASEEKSKSSHGIQRNAKSV